MKKSLDTTKFHRQLGLVDPDKLYDLRVAIIGVGAIGSMVGITLAKMGVGTLDLYDPDTVEPHNLPNQFYRTQDIGIDKASALTRTLIEDFGAFEVNAHFGAVDPNAFTLESGTDIVICAVDDMTFRKDFWEKCIKTHFNPKLYIETRMGGEDFRVYTVSPMDSTMHDPYLSTLYSTEEADGVACTERSILYNVMLIAAMVGAQVKKYVTEDDLSFEIMGDMRNNILFATPTAEPSVA